MIDVFSWLLFSKLRHQFLNGHTLLFASLHILDGDLVGGNLILANEHHVRHMAAVSIVHLLLHLDRVGIDQSAHTGAPQFCRTANAIRQAFSTEVDE